MADVLSQLQEASWRGISFPSLMFDVDGGHAIAVHKRVDRDGWRVENVGRNSYAFHFKACFVNSIARGARESWESGALFPDTYLRFIEALEDRSSGSFVHPIYGERTCKVATYKDTIDPDFRGGPVVVVSLVETIDDGSAAAGITAANNLSIASAAAVELDATLGTLTPPPNTGTPGGQSLTDFVKSLSAVTSQVDLFRQQMIGKVNGVINAMTNLAGQFGAVPGFSDNTNRLISALHASASQAVSKDKATSVYIVPKVSTVSAVAQRLGSTIPDLLALNPTLAYSPTVRPNTVVYYYA